MKGSNLYLLLVCGSKLPLPTWTGKNRRFQFGCTHSEGKRRCEGMGVLALGYEWGRVRSGPGAVTWVRSKVRLRKKQYKGLQPAWRSEGTDVLHRFFKWKKIWDIIRRTRGGFNKERKCVGHRVGRQRRDKSAFFRRNENRILCM